MKTKEPSIIFLLLAVFLVFGSSCRIVYPHRYHHSKTVIIHSNPSGKVPPGQMKKMTGEKSAKHYAPGQQKKHKRK
jgi:hypothetical protein